MSALPIGDFLMCCRSSHLSQGAVTGVGREEEAELSASLQAEGISVTRARSAYHSAPGRGIHGSPPPSMAGQRRTLL